MRAEMKAGMTKRSASPASGSPGLRWLATCATTVALVAGLSLTGATAAQAQGTAHICMVTDTSTCISNGNHNTIAKVTSAISHYAPLLFDNRVVWRGNKPTYLGSIGYAEWQAS